LVVRSALASTREDAVTTALEIEPDEKRVEVRRSTQDELDLPLFYDVAEIRKYWRARPLQVQKRLLEVTSLLTPYFLASILDSRTGRLKENPEKRRQRAKQFRNMLTKLGPAFIKLGQGLSVRPDLVGPEVMEELQQLCDSVPPFDNRTAMLMIEEELGQPVSEIYSEISEEPIAAASLGQVYRAKLRSTGEEVAVKVQRPDMLRKVSLDLYVMRKVFGAAQVAQDKFSNQKTEFIPLFDEWATGTYKELDYVAEGNNAVRFEELVSSRIDGVVVPEVFFEATSRKVLTTGWVNGKKLAEMPPDEVREMVGLGVQCFLTQLLDTGFFHADPHPGNLMVNEKKELVVLDFGLMSEVQSGQSDVFVAAVIHLGNRDYEAVVDDFIKLDFLKPDIDRSRVVPVLGAVLDQALEGGGAKAINFQTLSGELSQITFDFPFRIPPYAALIIRALGVLEGIALIGDPQFKMIMEAFPFVAKRVMSEDSPLLRKAFEDIIYVDGVLNAKRLQVLLDSSAGFLGDGDAFVDFDTPSSKPMDPTKSLEFLSSPDGRFVRGILADEIASSVQVLVKSSRLTMRQMLPGPIRAVLPFAPSELSEQDVRRLRSIREIMTFFADRQTATPPEVTLESATALLPRLGFTASEIGMMVMGTLSEKAVRGVFESSRQNGELVAGKRRFTRPLPPSTKPSKADA